MKVAITGANGFIGRALVRRLVDEGHAVLALTRNPKRDEKLFPAGVQRDQFDAMRPPGKGLLLGYEAVIHLAGAPIAERWTSEQKAKILDSRVWGTDAIAKAAVEAGTVRVVVSASGIGYYGTTGDEMLTESAASGSDFPAEVCRAWEKSALPARAAGIRTVNPRIGMVLHPKGGALAKMLLPFKLGAGAQMGNGKQYMSWIHLDDLLSVFLHALGDHSMEGPVNATSPNPVTNAEFTETLARVLHRPALFRAPTMAMRMALGEMSMLVTAGQRVVPKRLMDAGFEFAHPHLEEALASLLSPEKSGSGSAARAA